MEIVQGLLGVKYYASGQCYDMAYWDRLHPIVIVVVRGLFNIWYTLEHMELQMGHLRDFMKKNPISSVCEEEGY